MLDFILSNYWAKLKNLYEIYNRFTISKARHKAIHFALFVWNCLNGIKWQYIMFCLIFKTFRSHLFDEHYVKFIGFTLVSGNLV